ncbi:MAG: hypothetical protein K0S09_2341 [Sphingobacteriaceae bacterium]|jgi:hypothetical protein|nr:hypothetical protein [Sphingobacteriaceae bacterium]
MKKSLLAAACLLCAQAYAQQPVQQKSASTLSYQQSLFSLNTFTDEQHALMLNYSGSYGERTSNLSGLDGIDQQLSMKAYLGSRFTLFANAGLGFIGRGVQSTQQVEVVRDIVGGRKELGLRIGAGLGFKREWNSDKVMLSRFTANFDTQKWKTGGNLRIEKPFNVNRDNFDVLTSINFHHQVTPHFFAGIEAIGEDLEGFWDKEEAEGGAKLFAGPTLNYLPKAGLAFSLGAGPIIYATHSQGLADPVSRDLAYNGNSGFTVRAMVSFKIK